MLVMLGLAAVLTWGLFMSVTAARGAEVSNSYGGYTGPFGTSTDSPVQLAIGNIFVPPGGVVEAYVQGLVTFGSTPWHLYWTCDGGPILTDDFGNTRGIYITPGNANSGQIGPPKDFGRNCSYTLAMNGYGHIDQAFFIVTYDQAVIPPGPSEAPSTGPSPTPSSTPSPTPTPTPAPSFCWNALPSGMFGPPAPTACPTPTPSAELDCHAGETRLETPNGGDTSTTMTGRYLYLMGIGWDISWAGTSFVGPAINYNAVGASILGIPSPGAGNHSVGFWDDPTQDPSEGSATGGAAGIGLFGYAPAGAGGYIDGGSAGSHTVTINNWFTYSGYSWFVCLIGSDVGPGTFNGEGQSSPSPTFCFQPLPSGILGPPAPTVCPSGGDIYGSPSPGASGSSRPGGGNPGKPGILPGTGAGGNNTAFPGFGSPFGSCAASYPKPGQQNYWPTSGPAFPGLTLDLGVYANFIAGWIGAAAGVLVNVVLFLWNGIVDLVIPSDCLGPGIAAAIDGLIETLQTHVPFAWGAQAIDAMEGGIESPGGASDVSFTFALAGASVELPFGEMLAKLAPIRPLLVILVFWEVAIVGKGLVGGAVGVSKGGSGGDDA